MRLVRKSVTCITILTLFQWCLGNLSNSEFMNLTFLVVGWVVGLYYGEQIAKDVDRPQLSRDRWLHI